MTTITAVMKLALADHPTEEFNPRELYPLIAQAAAAAGWNDPVMDEYDNYDAERGHG